MSFSVISNNLFMLDHMVLFSAKTPVYPGSFLTPSEQCLRAISEAAPWAIVLRKVPNKTSVAPFRLCVFLWLTYSFPPGSSQRNEASIYLLKNMCSRHLALPVCHPYFIDEDAESQRDKVTFPRSSNWWLQTQDSNPDWMDFKVPVWHYDTPPPLINNRKDQKPFNYSKKDSQAKQGWWESWSLMTVCRLFWPYLKKKRQCFKKTLVALHILWKWHVQE